MSEPKRLLRISDVMERTTFSRSHIYARMKRGEFPRALSLGPKCTRWLESDINEWLEEQTKG